MSENSCLWFLFHEHRLVLAMDASGTHGIPQGSAPPAPPAGVCHSLGSLNGVQCLSYTVDAVPQNGGFVTVGLRSSFDILGPDLYQMAGKGWEMVHWDMHSRFCPVCGTAMSPETPVSKKCPACGHQAFPNISVAILALIRREDSILLVQAHNFSGPHYGLVAGFLETGETLEECVHREIQEETGLEVENVHYLASQPWPYPSGLMVGFAADYKSGILRLQEEELSHGEFFKAGNLPEIPHKLSLARQMIDWWLDGCQPQFR